MWEQKRLRDVASNVDVGRLWAEHLWVELSADCYDDIQRQLAQPRQNALEKVARLEVEDRS